MLSTQERSLTQGQAVPLISAVIHVSFCTMVPEQAGFWKPIVCTSYSEWETVVMYEQQRKEGSDAEDSGKSLFSDVA